MRKLVITAIVAFLIAVPAYAKDLPKPGYIINLFGDTIRGQILIMKEFERKVYPRLFVEVRFVDSSGKKTFFKPQELKGYGFAPMND